MAKMIINGEVCSGSTSYASAVEYTEKDGTKNTVQNKIVAMDSLVKAYENRIEYLEGFLEDSLFQEITLTGSGSLNSGSTSNGNVYKWIEFETPFVEVPTITAKETTGSSTKGVSYSDVTCSGFYIIVSSYYKNQDVSYSWTATGKVNTNSGLNNELINNELINDSDVYIEIENMISKYGKSSTFMLSFGSNNTNSPDGWDSGWSLIYKCSKIIAWNNSIVALNARNDANTFAGWDSLTKTITVQHTFDASMSSSTKKAELTTTWTHDPSITGIKKILNVDVISMRASQSNGITIPLNFWISEASEDASNLTIKCNLYNIEAKSYTTTVRFYLFVTGC